MIGIDRDTSFVSITRSITRTLIEIAPSTKESTRTGARISIGTIQAGATTVDMKDTVGMFIGTIVTIGTTTVGVTGLRQLTEAVTVWIGAIIMVRTIMLLPAITTTTTIRAFAIMVR